MELENCNILILAPHTDDAEFGCGGTIHKLLKQGHNVYIAAFSACEQSVLKEFPSDVLITEIKAATGRLGLSPGNLILYNYEVRTFNYRRQEILDNLIQLRNQIQPKIVFIPSMKDIHQDHHTIAIEGLRAFKFSTIYSYEMPWNNLEFNTCTFFVLNHEDLNAKIEALKEYKSQAHRPYSNEDFIRSLAKIRGVQINQEYAEVFEAVRIIHY